MPRLRWSATIAVLFGLLALSSVPTPAIAADPWVVYEGGAGPGQGKHIVLVSGDEEYRSEELLPQLAKILAKQHGFKCTVLFAIDPASGEINPNEQKNIPGLEALKSADLMILLTRFRDLPDDQMQPFVDYVNSGKPIIGLRTATHAFSISDGAKKFAKYSYKSNVPGWEQGFGKQVLGETWVNHHGRHKIESTKALVAPGIESHPILRGIASGEIWVPTDVYTVHLPLPGDSQPLLLGQVLDGMSPDSKPVTSRNDKAKSTPNEPMMPVAWTKTFTSPDAGPGTKPTRIFTTTMGSAQDLSNEAFRRLLVNASYWCLGMDTTIPPKNSADLVGDYQPSAFSPNQFKKGVKPADLMMK